MQLNWKPSVSQGKTVKTFLSRFEDNSRTENSLIYYFQKVNGSEKTILNLMTIFTCTPKEEIIDRKILQFIFEMSVNFVEENRFLEISLNCLTYLLNRGFDFNIPEENLQQFVNYIFSKTIYKTQSLDLLISYYTKHSTKFLYLILKDILNFLILNDNIDISKLLKIVINNKMKPKYIEYTSVLLNSKNYKNICGSLEIIDTYFQYFGEFSQQIAEKILEFFSFSNDVINIYSIKVLLKLQIFTERIFKEIFQFLKKDTNVCLWGIFYLLENIDKWEILLTNELLHDLITYIHLIPYKFSSKAILIIQQIIIKNPNDYMWAIDEVMQFIYDGECGPMIIIIILELLENVSFDADATQTLYECLYQYENEIGEYCKCENETISFLAKLIIDSVNFYFEDIQ